MNDAQLIDTLVRAAYDSGYYSGKREDGQPHHLAAIQERGRLRDAALQRLGDLRAALEACVERLRVWQAHLEVDDPTLETPKVVRTIQQARAALAATEAGDD